MSKNKKAKTSKPAKASKPVPKAAAKPVKPAPKKDIKPPQKNIKPVIATTKIVAKVPVAKETKKSAVVVPSKKEAVIVEPVKEITKEAKEAARVAEEKAMSLNLRSFRNQQDVEKFYRFVVENDLRREAKMVLDKIFVEVASQKKKRRAAAKKK